MSATTPINNREQSLINAMDRCGGFLFAFFKGLCGDAGMSEDLLQRLWVYVYEKYDEDDFCHIGYLKKKAFQLYVDEMRKKDSRPKIDCYEDIPEISSLDQPKEPSNSDEELRIYEDFWEQFSPLNLTELEESLFWYHVRFGYTMVELSEKFKIPKSTANDRIRDVRARCMKFLQGE